MRDVVLLSSNAKIKQAADFKFAQQLLHHGLATIVQFYPLTLQFKGGPNPAEDAALITPILPANLPCAHKSVYQKKKVEVTV